MDRIKTLAALILLFSPLFAAQAMPIGIYSQADIGLTSLKVGQSSYMQYSALPSLGDLFTETSGHQKIYDGGLHVGVFFRPTSRAILFCL